SIIDESYTSQEDLYDALLNTFFPIIIVVLFNVREESGRIKKVLLPLLDDILYNIITWVIPIIVSFTYDDTLACVFILILSLTRNVSYYTYEVPDDLLATSTAIVQSAMREGIDFVMKREGQDEDQQKSIDVKIKNMQEVIDFIMK
ncbi:3295_t:CDS:2, partial [Scutellospora calospora]